MRMNDEPQGFWLFALLYLCSIPLLNDQAVILKLSLFVTVNLTYQRFVRIYLIHSLVNKWSHTFTGYVGEGESGSMTPEQMYKERGDCSTDLQWSVCSADNKETENVILINRQRQVSFTLLRVDYGSISDV